MIPRKAIPHEARVDFSWRVDRDGGFDKATLIYDREGRLMAIDYHASERPPQFERKNPAGQDQ